MFRHSAWHQIIGTYLGLMYSRTFYSILAVDHQRRSIDQDSWLHMSESQVQDLLWVISQVDYLFGTPYPRVRLLISELLPRLNPSD